MTSTVKRSANWLKLVIPLLLLLTVSSSIVQAQSRTDPDGDGVPIGVDRCPKVPGPASNNGCPLPDKDGDGTPDQYDSCPTQGGPDWNGGCPQTDGNQVVPTQPATTDQDGDGVPDGTDGCPQVPGPISNSGCPIALPTTGPCVLATAGNDRVNIRKLPSTKAEVVGQLEPNVLYTIISSLLPAVQDGELVPAVYPSPEAWFLVDGGWVSAKVVRVGGDCAPKAKESFDMPCLALANLTAEQVKKLEAAGVDLGKLCQDEPPANPPCPLLANLTPDELAKLEAAGIDLGKLCDPTGVTGSNPCAWLNSLSAADLAKVQEIAPGLVERCKDSLKGTNSTGDRQCPFLANLTPEQIRKLQAEGIKIESLCWPPDPANNCPFLANLTPDEIARYQEAGIDLKAMCDDLNPPSEKPCPSMDSLTADELARMKDAGIDPGALCGQDFHFNFAASCLALGDLSQDELRRMIAAGIDLTRFCTDGKPPASPPCPSLANFTPEMLEAFRKAGADPSKLCAPDGHDAANLCPALDALSPDDLALFDNAITDLGDAAHGSGGGGGAGDVLRKACSPDTQPPVCPGIADLGPLQVRRFMGDGSVDLADICGTLNFDQGDNHPNDVLLNFTSGDPNDPALNFTLNFSLNFGPSPVKVLDAPGPCQGTVVPNYLVVVLAGSPYTGDADVTVNSHWFSGSICPEIIYGTDQDDIIGGGPGNDVLIGFGGNDLLNGGDGDDLLFGFAGNDTLVGGNGEDMLYGMGGDNTLSGGADNDELFGDSFQSAPFLLGCCIGLTDDQLAPFFPGIDIHAALFAPPGHDVLSGGGGALDTLVGGGLNDVLIGGSGEDLMMGDFGGGASDQLGTADYLDGGSNPSTGGVLNGDMCADGEVDDNCEIIVP